MNQSPRRPVQNPREPPSPLAQRRAGTFAPTHDTTNYFIPEVIHAPSSSEIIGRSTKDIEVTSINFIKQSRNQRSKKIQMTSKELQQYNLLCKSSEKFVNLCAEKVHGKNQEIDQRQIQIRRLEQGNNGERESSMQPQKEKQKSQQTNGQKKEEKIPQKKQKREQRRPQLKLSEQKQKTCSCCLYFLNLIKDLSKFCLELCEQSYEQKAISIKKIEEKQKQINPFHLNFFIEYIALNLKIYTQKFEKKISLIIKEIKDEQQRKQLLESGYLCEIQAEKQIAVQQLRKELFKKQKIIHEILKKKNQEVKSFQNQISKLRLQISNLETDLVLARSNRSQP